MAKGHYEEHDEDGVVMEGNAMEVMPATAIALLNASEIEQQITTARRYPRSLTNFTKEVRGLATLDPETAKSCIYALPRGGRSIEGPSVRFAEMANYGWGNTRVATRIVDIGDEFVTVEAMFFDLEKNTATKSEVMRRITNREGVRFDHDMIQVTAAAASAIARRNAILVGIPKTLWTPMYLAARGVVTNDVKPLANQRIDTVQAFAVFGIRPPQVYGMLGVNGHEEITRDHLVTLAGVLTSIKEKQITPEDAFAPDKMKTPGQGTPQKRPERSEFADDDGKKRKASAPKEKPAKAETKKQDAPAKAAEPEQAAADPKQQTKGDDTADWLAKQIAAADGIAHGDGGMSVLDKLDDTVCTQLDAAKRNDDLRPQWNAAYNRNKTRLSAPAETKEDRKRAEFADWIKDAEARLSKANTVDEVDAIQDEVTGQMTDAAEKKGFEGKCNARVVEIRSSRSR